MKSFILPIILGISSYCFAQDVVIDYEGWNPNNPPCNIFYPYANVPATGIASGNIRHTVILGQPQYNNSDKAIYLPCSYQTTGAGAYLATQFHITYPFKNGYSYQIKINASTIENTTGTQSAPKLILDLNSAGGGAQNQNCAGPEQLIPPSNSLPTQTISSSTQYADYIFPFQNINISGITPDLTVTGFPVYNGGIKTIRIKKITITETPPPASFTISSFITSMTCGATNPVTFTINNNGGTTGITGYTWNIGTTPNGWLYNGSPAPATISTTGNTLQLTPDCGKALSSVSATVAVGSNNYNTSNSAGISIIQPSYSISGNSVICSGSAVYSIFPTPSCNSSVSWQSSNTNIATVTSSGNSATVTKVGVGSVTLTATISNACGNTLPPVTKSIQLGDQGISSINLSWLSSCYGNSQSVQLDAIPSSAGTNWKWTVGSGNFAFTSNSTGSPSIQGYVTSWAIINLSYNGSNCQNQFTTSVTAYTNCSYRLAVSPNPATNSINLSIGSEVKDLQQNYMKLTLDTTGITKKITKPDLNSDTKGITNIYLYDFFTNRLVKKWAYRENSSATYNLNMADVKRGVYVLRVERDNISSTIKVILN